VEGIEIERHHVVAENVFPPRHTGAYLARIVLAEKRGIKILFVPGNPTDGFAAGGLAVGRLVLAEIGDTQKSGDLAAAEKVLKLRRMRRFTDVGGLAGQ
jgi:hypothetical protein